MLRMSMSTPCSIQGHLKLIRDPLYYGLGFYTDVDGVEWDVYGVFGGGFTKDGKSFIQARPVDNHVIYDTSTDVGCQGYSACWKPYTFEVVKDGKVN